MKKPQELGLTIFLLRPDRLSDFKKYVVAANQSFSLAPPLDGVAVVFPDTPEPPPWMAEINSLLQAPPPVNAFSQAPSALVLVKHKEPLLFCRSGTLGKSRQAYSGVSTVGSGMRWRDCKPSSRFARHRRRQRLM